MNRQPHRGWQALCAALLGALLAGASGWAASAERDPTQPPEAARAAAPSANTYTTPEEGSDAERLQALQHRMVINGQPYLVEHGWLRGVGDRLGRARIERIEERAVWLRDDQGLHKMDLFPQVEILALPPTPHDLSAPTAPRGRTSTTSRRHRPAAGTDLKDKTP